MATSTKVLKSGGSQAVRIPKEYRLQGDTVLLDRAGEGLLITPASRARKRAGRLKAEQTRARRPGFLRGLRIAEDFDAPLPARVLKDFGAT
jgi:virulence-associated protein VagC